VSSCRRTRAGARAKGSRLRMAWHRTAFPFQTQHRRGTTLTSLSEATVVSFAFRLEESEPEEVEAIEIAGAASVKESAAAARSGTGSSKCWELNGMPPLWLRQVEPILGEKGAVRWQRGEWRAH
jgi:hypothetical protein